MMTNERLALIRDANECHRRENRPQEIREELVVEVERLQCIEVDNPRIGLYSKVGKA